MLTVKDVKDMIRDLSDVSLKIITDLVAYQIRKGPYNKSPGVNYIAAEEAVAQSVSINFSSIEEFNKYLEEDGTGMKGIKSFAQKIYDHYYMIEPDFNSIKEMISTKKDISLVAITDMVAYKISQSAGDKGPEINYIAAETFVAQYVSKYFNDINTFKEKLTKYDESMEGISKFSDLIYNEYCKTNQEKI